MKPQFSNFEGIYRWKSTYSSIIDKIIIGNGRLSAYGRVQLKIYYNLRIFIKCNRHTLSRNTINIRIDYISQYVFAFIAYKIISIFYIFNINYYSLFYIELD